MKDAHLQNFLSFLKKTLDFPGGGRYNKTRSPARTPREYAPVAQLDRVSDYESEGREFESLPAHHAPHRGRDASVHFLFVCCIPAASEADHSTKEVNTSYRNNIFDFQGTTIKTPNHFTTVGVWCTLTKVKLYCKLSRR